MAEVQHLCMGCMKPIHETAVICPICGYNSQSVQHSPYLPKETVLAGRYLVGKTIAFDADNTTYIGFDLQRRVTVQIHEFLPEKIINRNDGSAVIGVKLGYERMYYTCCQAFKKLWHDIAALPKPSAAENVIDVFDENATAYAVSDYIDAITLEEYFSSNPPLSAEQASGAFEPIFATLTNLHNTGIIHGAISPLSIMLDSAGKLRLTGFSIAQTKSAIHELHRPPKDGYAPIELYDRTVPTTASADVYSVAAVFYTAVTGIIPPVASQRALNDTMVIPKEIAASLPANIIDAIVYAMRVYPQTRTKSISAFRSTLTAKPTANSSLEQINHNEVKKESKDTAEESSFSFALLAKMFACIFAVCIIVFCTLYTTFLYKNVDIPVLNSVFGAFSFLPMNMDKTEPSNEPTSEATTEEPTSTEEIVRMADFSGLTYQEVKLNAVYNHDFNITYEYEYSDTVEKDAVIRQSIPKGESVNRGTSVTLVISSGKAKVVLRDVIGQNYDIAYIMLTNDGFVVNKKVTENDGSQISNCVCTMSLVAGLEFEKGTEITLTVWE